MELIRRILSWTPNNLVSAFVMASFVSSITIFGFVMVGIALLEGGTGVDSLGELFLTIAGSLVWIIPIWFFVALGLALFGVLSTIWLRASFAKRWMWLVALGWGGAAGPAYYWLAVASTSDRIAPFVHMETVIFCIACGAFTGTVWWALARRVIRRDRTIVRETGEY